MGKKRANREGSFHQRAKNRWEGQIMIGYKPDGRRDIRSFSGATRTEVKEKMDAFLKQQNASVSIDPYMRFGPWADIWLDSRKGNVSETTLESYRYTLRILNNYFSDWLLKDIHVLHIEQFLQKLRNEGKSDSYLSKCRAMLFQIMSKATACDLISKNPVAYAEKVKKSPVHRKDSFTMEEVLLLMKNLPDSKIGWSIRLLIASGMRVGEFLGLESCHIAKDGSSVVINQAVVRIKGSIAVGPPKTPSSFRTIPIPEVVQYCARNLRNTDKKFIWEVGTPNMPCNPSYFAKQFKRAIESVEGVRVLTPHSCRHTFISISQMIGTDMETIRVLSGHTKVDMTRHYLHLQEEKRLEAAQRMSDAFSKIYENYNNT